MLYLCTISEVELLKDEVRNFPTESLYTAR